MQCEKPLGIAIFAVILFALGAMFVGGFSNNSSQYILNSQDQIPQIAIQGNAQLITTPDQAKLYLYITTLEDTAKLSQEENAKINEKVLSSLLLEGISKDDIKSTSYSVQVKQEWEQDKNGTYSYVFKGYETTHNIEVTVKDLDNVGDIADSAVGNGALINYFQFTLSDSKRKSIESSLIADAVSDAKSSALKIASSAGVKLGSLQSASYGAPSYYYPARYEYAMKDGAESAAPMAETILSSGQITVSISVSTSFAIE